MQTVLVACPASRPSVDADPPPGVFHAPQGIAASERLVLVVSSGFHYEEGRPAWGKGFVTFIDRATRQVVGQVPASAPNPQNLALHGGAAYVVCSGEPSVDRSGLVTAASDGALDHLDLSGGVPGTVRRSLPLGRSAVDPRIGVYGAIALDRAGRTAFLGSGTRGDLFRVDLDGWRLQRGPADPIALFPTPEGQNGLTVVRSVGEELAVLNFNSEELCLSQDLEGDLARRTCSPVGVQADLLEGPLDLARAPDGRLLVLMSIANALYRVSEGETPFAVEHAFARTGLASNRVVVHGEHAYVLNSLSNNLERVDLRSGSVDLPFAVLPVGSNPYDLVITEEPEGAVAWITLQGTHQVALVRLADGALLGLLPGEPPREAGVDGGAGDGPRCPDAGLAPVVGIGGVLEVSYGEGGGSGKDRLPGIVQRGPSGGGAGSGATDEVLSLGTGGSIIVDFGEHEVVDGPGPDFIVFENPFLLGPCAPYAEPALVGLSATDTAPASFTEFPCDLSRTEGDPGKAEWPYPGCAGVHPVLAGPGSCVSPVDPEVAGGDAFDLATLGLERARFLRLRDAGIPGMGENTRGFDLDAVVLIHHQKR